MRERKANDVPWITGRDWGGQNPCRRSSTTQEEVNQHQHQRGLGRMMVGRGCWVRAGKLGLGLVKDGGPGGGVDRTRRCTKLVQVRGHSGSGTGTGTRQRGATNGRAASLGRGWTLGSSGQGLITPFGPLDPLGQASRPPGQRFGRSWLVGTVKLNSNRPRMRHEVCVSGGEEDKKDGRRARLLFRRLGEAHVAQRKQKATGKWQVAVITLTLEAPHSARATAR